MLTGAAVAATFELVMPRPVGTPKATPAAFKLPDIDNLVRCVCDARTGVISAADDSQIVHLVAHERLARFHEPPGVRIELTDRAEAS